MPELDEVLPLLDVDVLDDEEEDEELDALAQGAAQLAFAQARRAVAAALVVQGGVC